MSSNGGEKKSTYFLDLYRDLYHREVAIAHQQMGRYALPVTVVTILIGALGFITREWADSEMSSAWGRLWWWTTILIVVAAAIGIIYTILCVVRAVWPRQLPASVSPGEIELYAKQLRDHRAQWEPQTNTAQGIEDSVDEWLMSRFRDDTTLQSKRNCDRGTWLGNAMRGLSISAVLVLVAFAFLTGVYLTKNSASHLPGTNTVPSAPKGATP